MYKLHLHRLFRLACVLVIIAASIFFSYYISSLIYPFIIACCIAFFINPMVNLFELKLRLPRYLAVLLSMVLIFSLLAGLITLLITEIIAGSTYLAKVVPTNFKEVVIFIENIATEQILPFYERITSMFNNLNTGQQATILSNIKGVGNHIAQTVGDFLQNVLQSIPVLLSVLPNAATVIIFSLLATFFISKDWYKLMAKSSLFIPKKVRENGQTVVLELKNALFGFIKAQLTLISITTIIVLFGLLVLKVDYAITVALLIGLVDILPYLGTGLVFVPWMIYAFATDNVSFAVGLSVLYAVVLVQRQIMEPKILSSSIGLDPLATLIALFVGYQLIGFFGLIVGPVILVILKTLHTTGVFKETWQFIIGK
ncbi:sporulation integral membrane protein YtvI [Priestia megaterium]|uniref:sporulation integral membrane protein YtvI n=1 Tax=Priestia megaterium TaxID=1404 RepID=UPI002877DC19|nr:sporulation integral membrane protein YtvI [Priestia megaterium]MBX4161443.1 sporulation integral membrane protein YtvI [Priestia megaterium]